MTSNSDKFEDVVHEWVPVGTTLKEAKHIMGHHGFECTLVKKDNPFNADHVDCLDCEKSSSFHNWNTRFFLKDDKVTGYGPSVVE